MRIELLAPQGMAAKAYVWVARLRESCPMQMTVTEEYEGTADILMLYGPGGPKRFAAFNAHRAAGGRTVTWDLGYWHRFGDKRHYRVSIDGLHPTPKQILAGAAYPNRWLAARLNVRNTYSRTGPAVLVGNSPKSITIGAEGWTQRALDRLKGRDIVYRPKRVGEYEELIGKYRIVAGTAIEDVLTGASLVVCRCSNVAIDACMASVPVVCEGGAAAAIYPSELNGPQPDANARKDFLHRLAWWQWHGGEMSTMWRWLTAKLDEN